MHALSTSTRRALLALPLALACAGALAPAHAHAKPVRIQLFGDSTQWGYDGKTDRAVPQPPAAVLQSAMDARFGAGAVIVTERAVPGTSAAQLLAGTDGRNRPWPQEVDADIVVVNHALNDCDQHVPLATYATSWQRCTPRSSRPPTRSPWTGPAAVCQRDAPGGASSTRRWPTWTRGCGRSRPGSRAGRRPASDAAGYRAIVLKVLMPTLEPLVARALQAFITRAFRGFCRALRAE